MGGRLAGGSRLPLTWRQVAPDPGGPGRRSAAGLRGWAVARPSRFPVLMSAHPYGKDNLPQRRGRGYRVSVQYRLLRQTGPARFSSLTGWEAPDPAWWAAGGYAVVDCDLRGAGTSGGSASLLSNQEGEDVCDLIGWAAAQPWSTGAVACWACPTWLSRSGMVPPSSPRVAFHWPREVFFLNW